MKTNFSKNDSYLVLTDGTRIEFDASNTPIESFTGEAEHEYYDAKAETHYWAYWINGQIAPVEEITKIHFGDSYNYVSSIGRGFLYGCSRLTALDLSGLKNVTRIGGGFLDAEWDKRPFNLTSLDLSGMKNLDSVGFHFLLGLRLNTLTLGAKTPPKMKITGFEVSHLIVPCGSEDDYKQSAWNYQAAVIICIRN